MTTDGSAKAPEVRWPCGCVTQKVGEEFYLQPCPDPACTVVAEVFATSKARGNRIERRRVT